MKPEPVNEARTRKWSQNQDWRSHARYWHHWPSTRKHPEDSPLNSPHKKKELAEKLEKLTAILLCEATFVSSILLNCETWVNLTQIEIEELESCDKILLRNILDTPSSTPIPALYLELGVLPLRFKIQSQRLLFF